MLSITEKEQSYLKFKQNIFAMYDIIKTHVERTGVVPKNKEIWAVFGKYPSYFEQAKKELIKQGIIVKEGRSFTWTGRAINESEIAPIAYPNEPRNLDFLKKTTIELAQFMNDYFLAHGRLPYQKEIEAKFKKSKYYFVARRVLMEQGLIVEVGPRKLNWNPKARLKVERIDFPAPSTTYEKLTRFIPTFLSRNGRPPTYEELEAHTRCTSYELNSALKKMMNEGLISQKRGTFLWVAKKSNPAASRPSLHRTQLKLVRVTKKYFLEHNRYPSIRQLSGILNVAIGTVSLVIDHMIELGMAQKAGKHKSFRWWLTDESFVKEVVVSEQNLGELNGLNKEVLAEIYTHFEQKKEVLPPSIIARFLGKSADSVYLVYRYLLCRGYLSIKIPAGYKKPIYCLPSQTGKGWEDTALEVVENIISFIVLHKHFPTIQILLKEMGKGGGAEADQELLNNLGCMARAGICRYIGGENPNNTFIQLITKEGTPAWLPLFSSPSGSLQGRHMKTVYNWMVNNYLAEGIPFSRTRLIEACDIKFSSVDCALAGLKGLGLIVPGKCGFVPVNKFIPAPTKIEAVVNDLAGVDYIRKLFNVSEATAQRIMGKVGKKLGGKFMARKTVIEQYGREYGYLL